LRAEDMGNRLNYVMQKYVYFNQPRLKSFEPIVVDRDRAFLYNKIKKNATKYIKDLISSGVTLSEAELERLGGKKHRASKLSVRSMPDNLSKYRSLLVLRDPTDRCLSAFLDKFSNQKEKYSGYEKFELTPQGFERFVSWLPDGGLEQDLHWDLQWNAIVFPMEFYTDVIRFENLNEKLPKIMMEAGYSKSLFDEEANKQKILRNKTFASDKRVDWISGDLKRRLETIYAKDYEIIDRFA
jgi:hypothetical protein